MNSLPVLHYRCANLPGDQAFEEWRDLMAPLFRVEHASFAPSLPRGSVSSYLLENIIPNRSIFNAQRISRERKRIDATPDHLLVQYYRTGGFHGELDGRSVTIRPGQIAICDLGRPIDVRASKSDTIGLAIPKHLLGGVDIARLTPRLSPEREQLLGAQMEALYRRVARMTTEEAGPVLADLMAFLHRLFDPSDAAGAVEGPEFRMALVELAERLIRAGLASAELTPQRLAERLGVSRATLYRAFAPIGGIERHVQQIRLEAIREALINPLDTRDIAQLAAAYGFATPAHLSRTFRAQFGQPPRELRREVLSGTIDAARSPEPAQRWWRQLGG